jgi:hypothetical protein
LPLLVLAFVGAYVALLVPFFIGRVSQRVSTRARIVLLLALPLAASLVGWLAFNRTLFRPGAQALEASTVEMVSGDGLALVTEKLGFFTAQAASCAFDVAGADSIVDEASPVGNAAHLFAAPASPAAGDATGAQNTTGTQGAEGILIDAGRTTTVRNISLGRFGSRLFLLKAVIALPVRVFVSESECVVANASPWALRGCFLSRNGRGYALGDVAPGATVRLSLGAAEAVGLPSGLAQVAGSARKADFISQAAVQGGETTMVRGWLDEPALAVRLDGAGRIPSRPPLTLLTVETQ